MVLALPKQHVLRLPDLAFPLALVVWPSRILPEGCSLRLRSVREDGISRDLVCGPDVAASLWDGRPWRVPGRDGPHMSTRDAVLYLGGLLTDPMPESVLESVCGQLSDPISLWETLWVMLS